MSRATPAEAGAPLVVPTPKGQRFSPRVALLVMASSATLPVTSLVTGPLIARSLGPAGRGYFAAIVVPLAVAPVLFNAGLPDAAAKLVASGRMRGAAVRVLSPSGALTGAVAAAVLAAISPLLLHNYLPGIVVLSTVGISLVVSMALDIVRGIRFGEGAYKRTVGERAGGALLRCVVIVALVVSNKLTVLTAVLAHQFSFVLAQLSLLNRRDLRTATRDVQARREAWHFGVRTWAGNAALLVNWRLDQLLILPLAGASELGYYAVAASLAEVPLLLFGQMRSVLFAEFSDRGGAERVGRAARALMLFLLLLVGGGLAIAPFLVTQLFGNKFTNAIVPAELLLLAMIPGGMIGVLSAALATAGRPAAQSIAQGAGVVVTLTGLPLLVPRWGATGAAVTTLVSYNVVFIVLVVLVSRTLHARPASLLVPQARDAVELVRGLWRPGRAKRGAHKPPPEDSAIIGCA